jgi:hypothetical protein
MLRLSYQLEIFSYEADYMCVCVLTLMIENLKRNSNRKYSITGLENFSTNIQF